MAENSDLKRLNQTYFLPNKDKSLPLLRPSSLKCCFVAEAIPSLSQSDGELVGWDQIVVWDQIDLRSLWEPISWASYLWGLWTVYSHVLYVPGVWLVNLFLLLQI